MVRHIDQEVPDDKLELISIEIARKIKTHWNPNEKVQIKVFTDGITNRLVGCYLSSSPQDVVLIRVYGNHTELFIDRKIEIRNMKLMHESGLSPPLYATFNNGICYGYTPGSVCSYEMVSDPRISSLIAAKLAHMHSLAFKNSTLNNRSSKGSMLFTTFEKYLKLVPRSLTDVVKDQRLKTEVLSVEDLGKEVQYLEKLLTGLGSPVVFCHNDLLLKNIIYHETPKTGVTFIDFEYADLNYQAFDIANHFCEFAGVDVYDPSLYPSEEFQLQWLRNYLNHWRNYEQHKMSLDEHVLILLHQVKRFSLAAHLFWGIWALIQSRHSSLNFDFLSYAVGRINQFLKEKDQINQTNGHSHNHGDHRK